MQSKNASYYLGLNSRHFEVNSSNWGLCLLSWFLLCKQLGEEVTYVRRALWKVKCSVKSKVLLFAKELYTWRNICRLWGADCSAGSCLADTKERNVGEELGHMAVVALPLVAPHGPPPSFPWSPSPPLLVQSSGIQGIGFGQGHTAETHCGRQGVFCPHRAVVSSRVRVLTYFVFKALRKLQDGCKLQSKFDVFDRYVNVHILFTKMFLPSQTLEHSNINWVDFPIYLNIRTHTHTYTCTYIYI